MLCLVLILLAVALSWKSRPVNLVPLSFRMTLGFGYWQSHSSLNAFHDMAAVGALGCRSFVTIIRKVHIEIMTFEFNKVGDRVDASECVEGVGLGDCSNGGFECPRTNGVNVHFISRGCNSMLGRQKSALPGGFLGDLVGSAGRYNSIDGYCEFLVIA